MVTRALPCFTKWYDIFYINNKKVLPLELYSLLDYEALAFWIMCDGTRNGTAIILQTQSFTIPAGGVFIINILMHKFDLKCQRSCMQRNQPTIYISCKSMKKLKPYILPYTINSMKYKFKI